EGWMMEGILELWDDFQSRTIAEDTSRSMRKNAEDGFFNGGPVPFGYRSVPVGKRRKLEVVEHEAAIVREVFRMYVEGHGAKSIAMSMNARGWQRRRAPWSKASAEWTLKNWVYAGYLVYSRHSNADRFDRDQSQWIKTLAHQPIIEEALFMEVQKRVSARASGTGKGSPLSTHLFTGMLKCGACGGAMTIETATGRSKTYSYYNCMKSMKGAGCSSRRIPARDFDQWMVDYIVTQVMSHDNLRKIAGDVHNTVVDWARSREEQRAAMVAELREIEARRLKLYDLMETTEKSALNLGDLSPRLRDLNARTRRLEVSLTDLENIEPPQVTVDEADLDSVRDFVREIITTSDNPRKVREFLSGFVERITIRDDGAEIEFRRDRLVTANATETVHSKKVWGG
ncbi:MAG: recombinase family protein, partial [Burkholderiales bacterium]|nr:recombinase family protein [Burkholderiales bacterium]